MEDHQSADFLRYRQRVIYSLFRAAARVGMRIKMPIDQMESLFQMAYFQEARERQGRELGDIAEIFGKSLRTVSSLHRRFRGDFFAPEHEVAFRIDLASWLGRNPSSFGELRAQYKDRKSHELEAALFDLVLGQQVIEVDGVYRRNPEQYSFVESADLSQRVNGLNRWMDILAEGIWRRFLGGPEETNKAVARSYNFAIRDEDVEGLKTDLVNWLRERLVEVDAKATDEGVQNSYGLMFVVTEMEDQS